mgnify:CR=1 FL=1
MGDFAVDHSKHRAERKLPAWPSLRIGESAFDDDDYPLLDEPHDTRPDLMQVIESLMDGSRGRKKKGK